MAAIGLPGWLALYFSLAVAGTWWVRRYAVRRALYDQPGERRSHAVPTPRGGGLSIVVAMLVALAWLAARHPDERGLLSAAAAGLLLVAGAGWADDHRPRSPWLRLGAHAVAALLLSAAFWSTGHGPWPALLALLAVPVLVNIWNFMDGIDGLAASQAAIAAAGYAVFGGDSPVSALSWALAAACCGFLPFNFPRAGIFLGDVGSGALGYLLAFLLAWLATGSGPSIPAWLPLLLPLSAFLIDASLTLARRIVRGERWWTGHVQHAYQGLARGIGRHWPVTAGYAAWTLVATILFVAMAGWGTAIKIAIPAACAVLGCMAWRVVQTSAIAGNRPQESPK